MSPSRIVTALLLLAIAGCLNVVQTPDEVELKEADCDALSLAATTIRHDGGSYTVTATVSNEGTSPIAVMRLAQTVTLRADLVDQNGTSTSQPYLFVPSPEPLRDDAVIELSPGGRLERSILLRVIAPKPHEIGLLVTYDSALAPDTPRVSVRWCEVYRAVYFPWDPSLGLPETAVRPPAMKGATETAPRGCFDLDLTGDAIPEPDGTLTLRASIANEGTSILTIVKPVPRLTLFAESAPAWRHAAEEANYAGSATPAQQPEITTLSPTQRISEELRVARPENSSQKFWLRYEAETRLGIPAHEGCEVSLYSDEIEVPSRVIT